MLVQNSHLHRHKIWEQTLPMHAQTLSYTRHVDTLSIRVDKIKLRLQEKLDQLSANPKNIFSLIISLQEEFPVVPTFAFTDLTQVKLWIYGKQYLSQRQLLKPSYCSYTGSFTFRSFYSKAR